MNIMNIIKGIGQRSKVIKTSELPSLGLFYPDDMKISITKCSEADIEIYESSFNASNILSVGSCVKSIIDKCVILNGKYSSNNIKSIDMLYLLLEIVKYTRKKEIYINYYNDIIGKEDKIEISSKTFNYINTTDLMQYYNRESKEFIINGYKYSIPSKGVEKSITEYLSTNMTQELVDKLDSYSYDFIYFLGNRDILTFAEIDNLIEIFNNDMDDEHKAIVSAVVEKFAPLLTYSLILDGRVIDFRSKIDLGNIWK